MDAAYAALNRTSADFWARRAGNPTLALRRPAGLDDLLLQTMLPFTGPERTILDVGAGAGRYAIPLASQVRSLTAVEPDTAMIPLLEQALDENGIGNVRIVASTWQQAEVERADVVLCAHVLYPIADAAPFLRKLDRSATRACFVSLRETVPEPEPLGRLWEHYHGEPRYLQPGYIEAFNVLHELGIHANVRTEPGPGPRWTYETLEQAIDAAREHLILREDPEIDARLRQELAAVLISDGPFLHLPAEPSYTAVLWWEKTRG